MTELRRMYMSAEDDMLKKKNPVFMRNYVQSSGCLAGSPEINRSCLCSPYEVPV